MDMYFLTVLETEKPKIKVLANLVPGESCLLACRWPPLTVSSHGLSMVPGWRDSELSDVSSCKDTNPFESRPQPYDFI